MASSGGFCEPASARVGLFAQLAGAGQDLVLDLARGAGVDRSVHPLAVLQHLAEHGDPQAIAAKLAAEDIRVGLEAFVGRAGGRIGTRMKPPPGGERGLQAL